MNDINEATSIELYRAKRKKQKRKRRMIILLSILAIAFLGIFGYYTVDIISNSSNGKNGAFPVKLNGDLILQNQMMGERVVILNDKKLLFYNNQGKLIREVGHSYFNPAVSCSSSKALLYDIKGTTFSVETDRGTELTQNISNDIIIGEIAENGNIAIVSEDDRYSCRLTIYDSKGTEIFKWYLADKYITSLDFTGSGDGCVVAALGVSNGYTETYVYRLDFSKDKEQYQTTITGSAPLMVNVMDNKTHIVCDNQAVVLDKNGGQLNSVIYSQTIKQSVAASERYTVMLFGEDVKSTSEIIVYDENLSEVAKISNAERIRKIDSDGNHVIALYNDRIVCYDMSLNQKTEYSGQSSVNDVICSLERGYSTNTTNLNSFALE